MLGVVYNKLSWQGTQAYNASAKSAHEAKMGDVLANWRGIPQWGLFLVFVPIVAYTFWHGAGFAGAAASLRPVLDGLGSEALRSQMTVPIALTKLLPVGLMGAFAAVMLAAAIGCNDTYLHSWGSIFIQDFIMPLRHLRALKLAILGVAAFSFGFSLIFEQKEYIFMFFAASAAIFVGGSGAVIIGGLYWKRGTTAAAWTAMIVGSILAGSGIVVRQLVPDFPVNSQMLWGLAMAVSSLVYVVVSLLTGGGRKAFDMDRLLHRGQYLVREEYKVIDAAPVKGWRVLGMGREFTRWDKIIYVATYAWTAGWVAVFVVGTVLNLTREVTTAAWIGFWKTYTLIYLAVSIVVIVWFSIGGLINLKEMVGTLRVMTRDDTDDGFVGRGRD
jgi:SSS family solute:Na+ symporter